MRRYLSDGLKIGERRHPAGCVRHPAEHVVVWLILAALWLTPLALVQAAVNATQPASQVLWYEQPAGNWESEALPIGNGRLGAMIFGAADKETIQINEDSLWLGDEKDTGMYQNLGEFEVALPQAKPVTNYRRELDISRAVHTVSYTSDGVAFRREAFASFPDQVMVFRITADKPGSHSGTLTFKDAHDAKLVIASNRLTVAGKLKNGLQYESQILVLNEGGTLSAPKAGAPARHHTAWSLSKSTRRPSARTPRYRRRTSKTTRHCLIALRWTTARRRPPSRRYRPPSGWPPTSKPMRRIRNWRTCCFNTDGIC